MSREYRPTVLERLGDLSELHQEHLGEINLWYVAYAPVIQTHLAMMTALCEQWHSETSSFHLPIGEATITLEDVWQILCLSIHGERVIYDVDTKYDACHEVMEMEAITLVTSQIDLEAYRGYVPTFKLIIAAIISDLVAPDQ